MPAAGLDRGKGPEESVTQKLRNLTPDILEGESRTQALVRNVEARMAAAKDHLDTLGLPKKKQSVRSWQALLQVRLFRAVILFSKS